MVTRTIQPVVFILVGHEVYAVRFRDNSESQKPERLSRTIVPYDPRGR